MLALGIDPGSAICGYGFVETDGAQLVARTYGAITTSPRAKMQDRLMKIYEELNALIVKYHPDVMGVEQLFFNRNATTVIPVGEARGVILLAAAENGLELVERTPIQVKLDITGYGKATKDQVIYMVTKLLQLKEAPHPDDVADALAIAVCTTHCMGSLSWRNDLAGSRSSLGVTGGHHKLHEDKVSDNSRLMELIHKAEARDRRQEQSVRQRQARQHLTGKAGKDK
jgi:crossover junction endodeoxyribonuclease RuvC